MLNINYEDCRVLIVDDHRPFHNDLREILCPQNTRRQVDRPDFASLVEFRRESAGCRYKIVSVYQGQVACQTIHDAAAAGCLFDLAFVAVRVPTGWDRIETIEQLWGIDPELQIVMCGRLSDANWRGMTQRLRHKAQSFLLRDPFDAFDVLQLVEILTQKQRTARQAELKQSNLNRTIGQVNNDLNNREAAPRQKNRFDSTSSMAGVLTHELCPIAPVESEFTIVSDIIDRLTQAVALRTTERVLVKVENGAPMATIAVNRVHMYDALERLFRSALDAIMLRGVITIDATTFDENDLRSVTAAQTGCSLPFRRYVAIRISDTGCSIPINVRDRIFTPFLTHDETKGAMGSGFSTVHAIVQQHGGWVVIESSFSVGTSVVINLPLVDLPSPGPDAPNSVENWGVASRIHSGNSSSVRPRLVQQRLSTPWTTHFPHLVVSHLTGSIVNFK